MNNMRIEKFFTKTKIGILFFTLWMSVMALGACGESAGSGPTNPAVTVTPTMTVASDKTPTVTPIPVSSSLKDSLGMVPSLYENKPIVFGDYKGARVAANMQNVLSKQDYEQLTNDQKESIYEGGSIPDVLAHLSEISPAGESRLELIGMDRFMFDFGIWYQGATADSPSFILMDGRFDESTIGNKLLGLDYEKDDYKGTAIYTLNADYTSDLQHPFRQYSLQMNRIAFVEGHLLAAPATEIITKFIDVHNGEASSLADNEPHRSLTEEVGISLLGGILMNSEFVEDEGNNRLVASPNLLDQYQNGPNKWGILTPYTLTLLAYAASDNERKLVVAIYYTDEEAAKRDASELEKRWQGFNYHLSSDDEVEFQMDKSCAPLTTRATADGSSVLIGSCPLAPREEADEEIRGPNLWMQLLANSELPFLIPNLSEWENQTQ
jgi:hypothetical protein